MPSGAVAADSRRRPLVLPALPPFRATACRFRGRAAIGRCPTNEHGKMEGWTPAPCPAPPNCPLSGPRPPASLYVAGPFSMGYVDFFTFLIPLYGLSLGLDASRDRHPRRGAIDPRSVPVDPYRRVDGPFRHARGDARVRLDRDAAGAAVSAGAEFLGPVAAAARQRRRRFLRLVGGADPDRPARRGRCAIYRQVQLFRPARLDLGADRRRGDMGFRRRVAGLSARRPHGGWC